MIIRVSTEAYNIASRISWGLKGKCIEALLKKNKDTVVKLKSANDPFFN